MDDNEAIIISACGRLPGHLGPAFANKGAIIINYFYIREDIRILVASNFLLSHFFQYLLTIGQYQLLH